MLKRSPPNKWLASPSASGEGLSQNLSGERFIIVVIVVIITTNPRDKAPSNRCAITSRSACGDCTAVAQTHKYYALLLCTVVVLFIRTPAWCIARNARSVGTHIARCTRAEYYGSDSNTRVVQRRRTRLVIIIVVKNIINRTRTIIRGVSPPYGGAVLYVCMLQRTPKIAFKPQSKNA